MSKSLPSPQAPGALPHRESLSVRLNWLHATSSPPNTAHHPSPATIESNGPNTPFICRPLTDSPSLLRAAPPSSSSTAYQACVSAARLACFAADAPPTSCPCSLPLRLHTHQAAFHIKLDLRPSTPPSVAHTHFLPTHLQHLRLPPPPCRGSSPRVRRRQCRPDLPAPTGLAQSHLDAMTLTHQQS